MGAIITGMESESGLAPFRPPISVRISTAASGSPASGLPRQWAARRAGGGEVVFEGEVGEVRERPRAAVAAHPVASDLGLDVHVLLDLGVPVVGAAGEGEEWDAAHLPFAGRVAQALAGVDDLAEGALEGDLVAIEEFAHAVEVGGGGVRQLGVRAQGSHLAADEDFAARHVLADALAGIAQDDDAPAIHHVAGHEVGVAGAAEGARLHHLAGARADIAVDHDLGAADRDSGDGAGVAAHRDGAGVHVVAQAPAGVVVHHEARLVGEAGAEIACRAAHAHRDRVDQADADMVARVGIDDLDVVAAGAVAADQLVGVADGDPP